ncbi:MAG TPA: alpha/beta hydrolase domain-containing protein [Bryobacteraceae bacterium]|nr:alpha/beta hydrolase domain-containing protein [Bryobacteraceae bacterium]
MFRRFALCALLVAAPVFAALTRVELVDRGDIQGGQAFANSGPYERIQARAYFDVDPNLPVNSGIVFLDMAPKNAQGRVEFSADLYILKPRDPAKGNGTALVEISNRGGRGLERMFDLGDHFLFDHGFTLVWVGWEFDVPPQPDLLKLYAPIATRNGRPISGVVRSEWTGDKLVDTIPLGDRTQIGYPAANPDDPSNMLTVRNHARDERTIIPRTNWTFKDDRHVTLKGGFEPGKIYEVVYKAKDPVVAGLGFAAIRDTISFLKFGGPETLLGDQHDTLNRAIGFGVSQSGRFLRDYLYQGFNEDEKNRRVFDGVWAHVAGAGRGSFNMPFAQPSRDGHPFLNLAYPVDVPPFTAESILERSRKEKVEPKLFLSNGSYEYWGRAASLIHTTPDGKQDVAPPSTARIYFFAGSQHGAGTLPPRHLEAQNLADTNDYRASMRALLVAMQSWLKDNREPPPSAYPMVSKDQLVSLGAFAFPKLPGLNLPHRKREAYRLDFTTEPPRIGDPYPSLVPQVGLDGNETSGIQMPEVQVPLASYTGWNLRAPAIGAPDELYSMVGSWIPFALNKTERENKKDPRPSIEERYTNKRDYLEKITAAAQKLVQAGYLLDEDVNKLRDRAAQEWDYVLRSN